MAQAKPIELQQLSELIAAYPIHKYIPALITYLEHRKEVAKRLVHFKGDEEAKKQFGEAITHFDDRIKEILHIPKN